MHPSTPHPTPPPPPPRGGGGGVGVNSSSSPPIFNNNAYDDGPSMSGTLTDKSGVDYLGTIIAHRGVWVGDADNATGIQVTNDHNFDDQSLFLRITTTITVGHAMTDDLLFCRT